MSTLRIFRGDMNQLGHARKPTLGWEVILFVLVILNAVCLIVVLEEEVVLGVVEMDGGGAREEKCVLRVERG